MDITVYTIENLFKDMTASLSAISMNKNLIDILKNPESQSEYERIKFTDYLMSTAVNSYLYKVESNLSIIDFTGNIYATWPHRKDEVQILEKYDWYNTILNSNGEFLWLFHKDSYVPNDSRPLISVAKLINDSLYGDYYGLAIISIYEKDLVNIFEYANDMDGSQIVLIDKHGMTISHTIKSSAGDRLFEKHQYEKIFNNKKGYITEVINGDKYIINFSTIKDSGWKIVYLIPYKIYFSEIENIRKANIISLITIMVLFVTITILISLKVTIPLKMLREKMINISEDDLNVLLPVKGNVEISDLITSYNKMINRIKSLMENIRSEQRKKEEMRFKALQAQINPHFLLNTLNNIKFVAYMSQANEVAKMIASLGLLMEQILGRGEDMVTLEEEIKYIKNYVYLQKIRLNDKFSVEYEIEDEVLKCRIFKFLLQPIIENCIYHGFNKNRIKGVINIKAQKVGADLAIIIRDNGVGMSDQKLDEIKNYIYCTNQTEAYEHIGLRNINERIVLKYGEKYGLSIKSEVNNGTIVHILLPFSHESNFGEDVND